MTTPRDDFLLRLRATWQVDDSAAVSSPREMARGVAHRVARDARRQFWRELALTVVVIAGVAAFPFGGVGALMSVRGRVLWILAGAHTLAAWALVTWMRSAILRSTTAATADYAVVLRTWAHRRLRVSVAFLAVSAIELTALVVWAVVSQVTWWVVLLGVAILGGAIVRLAHIHASARAAVQLASGLDVLCQEDGHGSWRHQAGVVGTLHWQPPEDP